MQIRATQSVNCLFQFPLNAPFLLSSAPHRPFMGANIYRLEGPLKIGQRLAFRPAGMVFLAQNRPFCPLNGWGGKAKHRRARPICPFGTAFAVEKTPHILQHSSRCRQLHRQLHPTNWPCFSSSKRRRSVKRADGVANRPQASSAVVAWCAVRRSCHRRCTRHASFL